MKNLHSFGKGSTTKMAYGKRWNDDGYNDGNNSAIFDK